MWFSKSSDSPTSKPTDEFSDLNINVDFNDDDLNDPDLLAELAKMTMDDQPKPKPKPKPVPTVPVVDVGAILANIPTDVEDDVQVEITEDDMNDPSLLAELASVTGTTEPAVTEEIKEITPQIQQLDSAKMIETRMEPMISPKVQAPTSNDEASLELKLKSTNIDMLMQQAQLEKVQALNKKRNGDKQGALDHLRASKKLQSRIEEISILNTTPQKITPLPSPEPPLEIPSLDPETILLYEERIVMYKKAALFLKKSNDIAKAREFLSVSKAIQQELELQKVGNGSTEYVLPSEPILEQAKTTKINPALISQVEPVPVVETLAKEVPVSNSITSPTSHSELIETLVKQLNHQIQLCTKLSAQYFTSNQKDLALEYHKKKKGMMQDIETLTSMTTLTSSSLPFTFSYVPLEYTIAQTHQDVPLDEINICVKRATDIYIKDVTELETLVTFDLGWPSNASGTLPQGKGETRIVNGSDPSIIKLMIEYDFSTNIKIERTKAFQRILERRKITFEVYYIVKTMFGIMSRRNLFGKISIKLDDLLSKREIHQMVPITDAQNPRKVIGGQLEVLLRMRAPLIKPDIITNSEKWLVVVFGDSNTKIHMETNPKPNNSIPQILISPSTLSNSNESTTALGAKHPSQVSIASSQKSNSDPKHIQMEELDDDFEQDFLNPDNITSNQVLEQEHGMIVAQLAKTPNNEELQHMKSGYEIKMQMLVTSIQLGTLDLHTYINQVKNAIQTTKKQALGFKKRGNMELAKKAMVRVKLMTAEVEEVESQQS